jgi:ParB family chromosome partitioning protein
MGRSLSPRLIDVPAELVEFKSRLDAELEQIEEAIEDTESDALLDQQQAVRHQLDEVEEKLAAFVGFDAEQKALAGCFVSIGQDGTPFIDKGLVRPEHRKQLAKLLTTDDGDGEPVKAKPKGQLPETLRRALAAQRLQVAQVEIARNPGIALDLLAFQVASRMLDERPCADGPDVEFNRPRLTTGSQEEPTVATCTLAATRQSLPDGWRKPKSEVARFEAFRSLPEATKLELLAYCMALTLQPKLGPSEGDEATAYDAALSLTAADVAGYWRPGKDNFLGRISRDQLLAVSREVLGEPWAQSHFTDKKALLVDQLDRAFSSPEKSGRTQDQVEKLKCWPPAGMAFGTFPTPKPAKGKKPRNAA